MRYPKTLFCFVRVPTLAFRAEDPFTAAPNKDAQGEHFSKHGGNDPESVFITVLFPTVPLRVQVPNYHILLKIVTYITTIPNPST